MAYRVLLTRSEQLLPSREGMERVLSVAKFDSKGFAMGATKLFFKVGVLAQLEDLK